MSRTRSRGVNRQSMELVGGSKIVLCNHTSPGVNSFSDVSPAGSIPCLLTDQELIGDDLGRTRFNPCSHISNRPHYIFGKGAKASGAVSDDNPYGVYMLSCDLGDFSGYYSIDRHLLDTTWPEPSLPDIDWHNLVGDVGDRLDGSMQSSSNLLVAMAEIGQTVGMIKNPFGLLKKDWRKTAERLSPSRLSKRAANVWLETRYGWMNFYRDVIAFSKAHSEVQAHLRYLADSSGSWSSLSKSQVDSDSSPPQSINVDNAPLNSYQVIPEFVEFSRRACFSCDIWRGQGFQNFNVMDLMIQRMGVDQVASALWDLIPLSFTVDWFVNLGTMLKRDPIFWNRYQLRNMGYSVKKLWKFDITIKSHASAYGVPDATTETCFGPQIVHTSYERVPGFPASTSTVGLFGGINLTHLADGAALVAQRI